MLQHRKFFFLPIEPCARPEKNRRESFGKRTHQFAPRIPGTSKSGLFRKPSEASKQTAVPPSITVEGRLPDPAIVYCDEVLPLRILVTKQNDSNATVFLQSLHVEVLGHTGIRANELRRSEITSWTIMSSSDMKKPMSKSTTNEDGDRVLEIDAKLWNQKPLPNTITPTFETCNLSRSYTVDLKVGLSWGVGNEIFVSKSVICDQDHTDDQQPELTVQPIRLPVQVWSGIRTPQALLDAAAGRLPPRPSTHQQQPSPATPTRPDRPPAFGSTPQPPPQTGSDHVEPSPEDIPVDAPPTYEEAMADGVPPIDGPRRDFQQQQSQGLPSDGQDEKRGLFP